MELIAFVLAVIFWWTFWNRLNRIMIAVERVADHMTKGASTVEQASVEPPGAGGNVREFDRGQQYVVGEIVVHPEYGRGRVEKFDRDDIVVQFSSGRRSFEPRRT
jgi:hypothetical protein